MTETNCTMNEAWISDQGDGTFINPILHADYSDPDVIRVGNDFYMTASSFGHIPGLPILHSKDLVNWKLINHAIPKMNLPGTTCRSTEMGYGLQVCVIMQGSTGFSMAILTSEL